MTTSRRAFLGTVAGALIFAGGAARAAGGLGPLNEVRIGYQKEGILAVVKQRGAIEARLAKLGVRKVRWVLFKYGMPMMEALGAGSIDIASVGDTPPVFAQAAGMNVLYVAAAPAAQNAILVAPRSPLRGAADLRGRKVALVRGSSSHNFTIQALKAAGLQFADIVPTFLDPADAERALMRGDVDAWTVWDPYIALAELRHKVRAIATNETIYPSSSFYLANTGFAAQHSRELAAVVDALERTYAWADKHRPQAAAAIAQVTGVALPAQKRTLARLKISLAPLDDRTIAQQQGIADTFKALDLIPRAITVRDAVWRLPAD